VWQLDLTALKMYVGWLTFANSTTPATTTTTAETTTHTKDENQI